MADINPILRAAKAASTAQDTGAAQIQNITAEQADASMAIMDIVRQRGAADRLVSDTEGLGKLAEQQAIQKVGDIYGTNVSKSNERMSALADEASKAYLDAQAAEAEIYKKKSVNFFDDPLSWISNRFTINQDIAAFNDAATRQDMAEKRQSDLNAQTHAGVLSQKAFTQTITAASIAAKGDSIEQGAEILAQQARQQALTYNIRGVEAAMKMPLDKLQIVTNVYHAQQAQEQQKMALAHLAMAQEKFKWEKDKKETEDSFDARLVNTYNKGLEVTQGSKAVPVDPTSKEAKFIAQMLKSNSEAGKEYQRTFFAGQSGVIAPNVMGTINAIATGSGVNFSASQGKVKELLGETNKLVAMNPAIDKKDPKAVSAAYSAAAAKLVDDGLANIKVGSGDLFDPPSMNQIIKLDPQLQNLPVVQKVLAPLMNSGVSLEPARALPAIAAAVAKGELTFEQARQASAIFQRQVTTNVADKNLIKFGISPGKETLTSFKTQVVTDPNAVFGGKEIVNIADPTEWGKAVMKYNTRAAMYERAAAGSSSVAIDKLFTPDSPEYSGGAPNIYNTNPEYWKNVRGNK